MKLSRLLRHSPITYLDATAEAPATKPDTRTYMVTSYYRNPTRKITQFGPLGTVQELERIAFASGATRCEVEPEWQLKSGAA